MELSVGTLTAAVTLKERLPLVPPAVVTETLLPPVAAFAAMLNVAVALVLLTTDTFDTVIPLPLWTVSGATKPVPVRVTFTAVPFTPLFGATEVRVGTTPVAVTPKGTVPLPPAVVVTERLCCPTVAFAARVSVAVICVALTTATLLTVTPLPVTPTVAPAVKFVPARVTFTAEPCTPLFGVTDVRVGPLPAAVTVNVSMLLLPALVTTQVLCAPSAALDETL